MAMDHAFRRALLVPLRLAVVLLSLSAVVAVMGWNLHTTRVLLDEQRQLTLLMGMPGWRVSLPLDETALGLRLQWADTGLLATAEEDRVVLALLPAPRAVRQPGAAAALYHPLLIAGPNSGLASRDAGGGTPCVWLGPQRPAGAEWVVEERLRCSVSAAPAGWAALNAELDQASLVLPWNAASLVLGADWSRASPVMFMAGTSPCRTLSVLRCERLSATRAAAVAAGASISGWTRWSLPAALLAAMVAVGVYLSGLKPVLTQEFALRMALGRPFGAAMRSLVEAQLAQLLCLLLGVAAALSLLVMWLGIRPSTWDSACSGLALLGSGLMATGQALSWAWHARHQGLQALGRVG